MVQKYKILAVDDNPINLKLLSHALVNTDYQIFTASSGKEALELVQKELPDLVLLDVMMPDMDGYEVCKKLQENEATRFIPVIFLSARNEPVDKAKGLALGAVDYLTKPFNPLEISARVRTHLSSRKAIINLMRKNQQLQQELNRLQTQNSKQQQETIQFLEKIDGNFYHLKEERYEFFSIVNSKIRPITRSTIPIYHTDDGLILLHFNGFSKNYATVVVKHLVQQFLVGYFQERPVTFFKQQNELTKLFLLLLEKFSPDIYPVNFTFGLTAIDFQQQLLFFYALNLTELLQILPNGKSQPVNGQQIKIESELKNFISAYQLSITPGQWIAFYQNDSKPVELEQVTKQILPALEKSGFDLQKFILQFDQQVTPTEQDVHLMVVTFE